MLCGIPPCAQPGIPLIQAPNVKAILGAVVAGDWSFPKACTLSDPGRDFLRGLLVTDPKARLTAPEAEEHFWLQPTTGDDAPCLPAVQASVAAFRRSLEVGGENEEANTSWVHVDAAMVAGCKLFTLLRTPPVRARKAWFMAK